MTACTKGIYDPNLTTELTARQTARKRDTSTRQLCIKVMKVSKNSNKDIFIIYLVCCMF